MNIIGFYEMKAEDYVNSTGQIQMPTIMKCIALKDIDVFTLSVQPTKDEYMMLFQEGFIEYSDKFNDGLYHFCRKERLGAETRFVQL